jgi:hypothetical protein
MRIDRSAYSEYFTNEDTPSWNCSSCNKGRINLSIEDLAVTETRHSVEDRKEEE